MRKPSHRPLGVPSTYRPPGSFTASFSVTDQGLTFPDITSYLTLGMVQSLPVSPSLFSTQRRGRWMSPEKAAGEVVF